jgi:hypothetical protein
MKRTRLLGAAFGVLGAGLAVVGPAGVAASASSSTQFCAVPVVNVDPDSVALTGPVAGLGGTATAAVTAAETPAEQGPGAPTVRLYVFRQGGANQVTDLLHALMGPSQSGPVALSGPATGKGSATETVKFSAPGTYTLGFIALFDNGIHPCTSLLPTNHAFTVTVPST